jgi:hypothetical protein
MSLTIRSARPEDTALILQMIRELADFEQLLDQVVADEATLRHSLFSDPKGPEVLIAEEGKHPVGFVPFLPQFFHVSRQERNLHRRSLRSARISRKRIWRTNSERDLPIGQNAPLRARRVVGARLERTGDQVLQKNRGNPHVRMDGISAHREIDRWTS